jgi:hypothetical protein
VLRGVGNPVVDHEGRASTVSTILKWWDPMRPNELNR